jgi:predicted phosphoribosyltransferase
MIFQDRLEAASLLLKKLNQYQNQNVVVAGIPRGAIPMAALIAKNLGGELTAVLVRKISDPHDEEFAIGSLGLSGHIYLSPWAKVNTDQETLAHAIAKEREVLHERKRRYGLKAPHYKGRTVIIVDDGIATGATTLSAVKEVRTWGARKIVLAVPVASKEAASLLSREVDELIVLTLPDFMGSVGEFYLRFPQVNDEEVERLLRGSNHSSLELF